MCPQSEIEGLIEKIRGGFTHFRQVNSKTKNYFYPKNRPEKKGAGKYSGNLTHFTRVFVACVVAYIFLSYLFIEPFTGYGARGLSAIHTNLVV